MKKIALGISLVALSASAAWAQGQPTGPTTVPPPPRGAQTAPTTAPAATPPRDYGQTAASRAQRDVPPYTAEVGPRQGDWEGFIGGSGSSSSGEFNDNNLGVSASIGYYVFNWMPVSLRQAVATRFGSAVEDEWDFATTGAIDFQAPLGRFQPFIGVFGGYSYGDQNSALAGPEGGIKFYVNESTFIQGLMQYGWLLDKSFESDEGRAVYTIGMGFNF
jgi:hypothetical protein